eukprot:2107487-Karenia_brevis.AAC.1
MSVGNTSEYYIQKENNPIWCCVCARCYGIAKIPVIHLSGQSVTLMSVGDSHTIQCKKLELKLWEHRCRRTKPCSTSDTSGSDDHTLSALRLQNAIRE